MLGRASSLRFAREGAAVAVLDIASGAAAETVRLIEQDGGTATALVADVADEAQVARAVGEAVEALGGLDLLFTSPIPRRGRSGWPAFPSGASERRTTSPAWPASSPRTTRPGSPVRW
jgi:hypothetical protein